MKDKLSKLLREAFLYLLDTKKSFSHANYADFLLANGVIVPPCKVGQKIYVMESEFTGFWECIIISTLYDGFQWFGQLTPLSKLCHGSRWKWQEAEFGKTIFFTQEEAKIAQKKAETKEE